MTLKNNKIVAIVVARLSSSRLPGKHFAKLLDKHLIEWVVDELEQSRYIDEIVIATTDRTEDDRLFTYAAEKKVACYRYSGDINEVTRRIRSAAEHSGADVVINVSGDCPLIFSPTMDRMVEKLLEEESEICGIAKKGGRECIHEGIGVMTINAWRKIDGLSVEPFYQEHPGSYVKDHGNEFSICAVTDKDIFYEINHRISVDTPADIEFMNRAFSILNKKGMRVDLPNVIALLKELPELMEINRHVYQRKLHDSTQKVLFRVNGGQGIGMGHIARQIAVAKKLMESKGAGVRFLVNNDRSITDRLKKEKLPLFILPEKTQQDEEIPGLREISKEFDFTAIVLDLNENISASYIKALKSFNIPIVSLDNASEGACLADVNIFPVAHFDSSVLDHCKSTGHIYGGTDYVVINDNYRTSRPDKNSYEDDVLNILITFGGSDPNNLSERVVTALLSSNEPVTLDVVIGPAFQDASVLEKLSQKHKDKIKIHKNIDNLAGLMAKADIAFTALGITIFELAYMGVPAVIVANYQKDEMCLGSLKQLGIVQPLGYHEDVTDNDIRDALHMFAENRELLKEMSRKGRQLIDGKGTERIADIINKTIGSSTLVKAHENT